MRQEKKEEEDSPEEKTADMHQHKDSRTILKRTKKDL